MMQQTEKRQILTFWSVAVLLGMVVLLTTGTQSFAEEAYPVYSAKFVCGPIATDADVVHGQYATVVNVHNPQPTDVTFEKKAVIALPERNTTRGAISAVRTETLGPDQAMGVDCKDIRSLFAGKITEHSEGFVVITVRDARFDILAVVSVYSARDNDESDDDDDDDGDDEDSDDDNGGGKDDDDDDGDNGSGNDDDDDDDDDDDGVASVHIEEVHPKWIPIKSDP